LQATSVCETCKKGLIHSHVVHVWGEENGEEVTVYYFKCDNCGDISTREEENGK
jgi:RNase P subunit RPR2